MLKGALGLSAPQFVSGNHDLAKAVSELPILSPLRDALVRLAPNTNTPFTGTRWQVIQIGYNNPNIVLLKCLGDIEGPRWLNGRTADGTVGVAHTQGFQRPSLGDRIVSFCRSGVSLDLDCGDSDKKGRSLEK